VVAGHGEVGGGALPLQRLPGWVVEIEQAGRDAAELERRARAATPPVIGTLRAGRWRLDPRTLAEGELNEVVDVLARALAPGD
jgi:L-seryl-tRNA(Ser) seleniumtransferase